MTTSQGWVLSFKNVPITILRGIFDEVREALPNIHNVSQCEQGLKIC